MHAPLFSSFAVAWIRRPARAHGLNHPALSGNDDEENVRGHDGPNSSADVDVGGPSAELSREPPGKTNTQREHDKAKQSISSTKRRPAKKVVNNPGTDH